MKTRSFPCTLVSLLFLFTLVQSTVVATTTSYLSISTSYETGTAVLSDVYPLPDDLCHTGTATGSVSTLSYTASYFVDSATITSTPDSSGASTITHQFYITWYFKFSESAHFNVLEVLYYGSDISDIFAVFDEANGKFLAAYTVSIPDTDFENAMASFASNEFISFVWANFGDDGEIYAYAMFPADPETLQLSSISNVMCAQASDPINCYFSYGTFGFDFEGLADSCNTADGSASASSSISSIETTSSSSSSSEVSPESSESCSTEISMQSLSDEISSPSPASSSTSSTASSSVSSLAPAVTYTPITGITTDSTVTSIPQPSDACLSSSMTRFMGAFGTTVWYTASYAVELKTTTSAVTSSSTSTTAAQTTSSLLLPKRATVPETTTQQQQFVVTWFFEFGQYAPIPDSLRGFYVGDSLGQFEGQYNLNSREVAFSYTLTFDEEDVSSGDIAFMCLENYFVLDWEIEMPAGTVWQAAFISGVSDDSKNDAVAYEVCGDVDMDSCHKLIINMNFDCTDLQSACAPVTSALSSIFESSSSASSSQSSSVSLYTSESGISQSQSSSVSSTPLPTLYQTAAEIGYVQSISSQQLPSEACFVGTKSGAISSKSYTVSYAIETLEGTTSALSATTTSIPATASTVTTAIPFRKRDGTDPSPQQFRMTWYFSFDSPILASDFDYYFTSERITDVEILFSFFQGAATVSYTLIFDSSDLTSELPDFCSNDFFTIHFTTMSIVVEKAVYQDYVVVFGPETTVGTTVLGEAVCSGHDSTYGTSDCNIGWAFVDYDCSGIQQMVDQCSISSGSSSALTSEASSSQYSFVVSEASFAESLSTISSEVLSSEISSSDIPSSSSAFTSGGTTSTSISSSATSSFTSVLSSSSTSSISVAFTTLSASSTASQITEVPTSVCSTGTISSVSVSGVSGSYTGKYAIDASLNSGEIKYTITWLVQVTDIAEGFDNYVYYYGEKFQDVTAIRHSPYLNDQLLTSYTLTFSEENLASEVADFCSSETNIMYFRIRAASYGWYNFNFVVGNSVSPPVVEQADALGAAYQLKFDNYLDFDCLGLVQMADQCLGLLSSSSSVFESSSGVSETSAISSAVPSADSFDASSESSSSLLTASPDSFSASSLTDFVWYNSSSLDISSSISPAIELSSSTLSSETFSSLPSESDSMTSSTTLESTISSALSVSFSIDSLADDFSSLPSVSSNTWSSENDFIESTASSASSGSSSSLGTATSSSSSSAVSQSSFAITETNAPTPWFDGSLVNDQPHWNLNIPGSLGPWTSVYLTGSSPNDAVRFTDVHFVVDEVLVQGSVVRSDTAYGGQFFNTIDESSTLVFVISSTALTAAPYITEATVTISYPDGKTLLLLVKRSEATYELTYSITENPTAFATSSSELSSLSLLTTLSSSSTESATSYASTIESFSSEISSVEVSSFVGASSDVPSSGELSSVLTTSMPSFLTDSSLGIPSTDSSSAEVTSLPSSIAVSFSKDLIDSSSFSKVSSTSIESSVETYSKIHESARSSAFTDHSVEISLSVLETSAVTSFEPSSVETSFEAFSSDNSVIITSEIPESSAVSSSTIPSSMVSSSHYPGNWSFSNSFSESASTWYPSPSNTLNNAIGSSSTVSQASFVSTESIVATPWLDGSIIDGQPHWDLHIPGTLGPWTSVSIAGSSQNDALSFNDVHFAVDGVAVTSSTGYSSTSYTGEYEGAISDNSVLVLSISSRALNYAPYINDAVVTIVTTDDAKLLLFVKRAITTYDLSNTIDDDADLTSSVTSSNPSTSDAALSSLSSGGLSASSSSETSVYSSSTLNSLMIPSSPSPFSSLTSFPSLTSSSLSLRGTSSLSSQVESLSSAASALVFLAPADSSSGSSSIEISSSSVPTSRSDDTAATSFSLSPTTIATSSTITGITSLASSAVSTTVDSSGISERSSFVTSLAYSTTTVDQSSTTVVTITSCPNGICSEVTKTTAVTVVTTTVSGTDTEYITYCPLTTTSAEPVFESQALSANFSTAESNVGKETDDSFVIISAASPESTTVVTLTSCSNSVCSKSPVTTGLTVVRTTSSGILTDYTTFCPLSESSSSTTAVSSSSIDQASLATVQSSESTSKANAVDQASSESGEATVAVTTKSEVKTAAVTKTALTTVESSLATAIAVSPVSTAQESSMDSLTTFEGSAVSLGGSLVLGLVPALLFALI